MNLSKYLMNQMRLHPAMQPQDIVKLCYQAAYGAEHLLEDAEAAKTYFYSEFNLVPAKEGMLYEEISSQICRVNLAAWKKKGLPAEWLFSMFLKSARGFEKRTELFEQYLEQAGEFVRKADVPITLEAWNEYLRKYTETGMGAVHHSRIYRDNENPAYRIIDSRFLHVFEVLEKFVLLSKTESAIRVVAIDGPAAAGKSTMAEVLKDILGAPVVHMDDFFLPLELRSEERFKEAGGNVHYERFIEEVIPHIGTSEKFSYRIFDCGRMDYDGERVIKNHMWRIVEGAYSCHPKLGDYADLKLFLDVGKEEQIQRIRKRNGEEMAEMFRTQWIPMEEKYFEEYCIRENVDIVI